MVDIVISRGLDLPIKGNPAGPVKPLIPGGTAVARAIPERLALNLTPFDGLRFELLAKEGAVVITGEPLLCDKKAPGRYFLSPATGFIKEIRRGLKRRLLYIIIETQPEERFHTFDPVDISSVGREKLIEALSKGGIFSYLRRRPFDLLAHPDEKPRSIFVKALESAPFAPPAELQIAGHETEFQYGLTALSKLTNGPVHLVYLQDTLCKAFTEAKNVVHHRASGPHPIANPSLHIQRIDPIKTVEDVVWTATAADVVLMGHLLKHGRFLTERIVSIAGPGILPDRTGYFKIRLGYPIEALIADRLHTGEVRLISGDPLTGQKVHPSDFLGFYHHTFSAIPETSEREMLHFFRLGLHKYSFSRAYLSGHLDNSQRKYDFTTSQHGEKRAFIDSTLYDQVMPLDISTMHLVKAVMAGDFDLAEALGLLEVSSEDFALPAFVDPSKIEMIEIIQQGLQQHASEVLT